MVTSHSSPSPPARQRQRQRQRPPLYPAEVRTVVLTVVAALLVNTVIFLIGSRTGGRYLFTSGGVTQTTGISSVALYTGVPLLLGMALAAVMSHRWPGVLRLAEVTASVLTLATVAATVSVRWDRPSLIALTAMHIALVPISIAGLEHLRRTTRANGTPGPTPTDHNPKEHS